MSGSASAGWAAVLCVVLAITVGCAGSAPTPVPTVGSKGAPSMFTLTSPAFPAEKAIPARFAFQGASGGNNTSIPYEWTGAPPGTRSFALAFVDRAPAAHDWVHWAVVDIPATTSAIPEGASGTSAMPTGARELRNTFGTVGYGGPLPPPRSGPHRYEATLYALDTASLSVSGAVSAADIERAVEGHVLAKAAHSGYFER